MASPMHSSLAQSHPKSVAESVTRKVAPLNPGELLELCADLTALIQEGLLKAETDEYNVVRYEVIERA